MKSICLRRCTSRGCNRLLVVAVGIELCWLPALRSWTRRLDDQTLRKMRVLRMPLIIDGKMTVMNTLYTLTGLFNAFEEEHTWESNRKTQREYRMKVFSGNAVHLPGCHLSDQECKEWGPQPMEWSMKAKPNFLSWRDLQLDGEWWGNGWRWSWPAHKSENS